MAFVAINSTQILAGKPVTQDLWTKVKDNFDDHETRMAGLETTVLKFTPLGFRFGGNHAEYGADRGYPCIVPGEVHEINFDIDLLGATLVIHTAGSGGTTEVDLQYKRGVGAWTSLFTVGGRPKTSSTTDYAKSATPTFAVTQLLTGDLVRLVLIQSQTGTPDGLNVSLFYGGS